MSHSESPVFEQNSKLIDEIPTSISNETNIIDIPSDIRSGHQAKVHRHAPTRHSVKSSSNRKTLTRQTSLAEVINI